MRHDVLFRRPQSRAAAKPEPTSFRWPELCVSWRLWAPSFQGCLPTPFKEPSHPTCRPPIGRPKLLASWQLWAPAFQGCWPSPSKEPQCPTYPASDPSCARFCLLKRKGAYLSVSCSAPENACRLMSWQSVLKLKSCGLYPGTAISSDATSEVLCVWMDGACMS